MSILNFFKKETKNVIHPYRTLGFSYDESYMEHLKLYVEDYSHFDFTTSIKDISSFFTNKYDLIILIYCSKKLNPKQLGTLIKTLKHNFKSKVLVCDNTSWKDSSFESGADYFMFTDLSNDSIRAYSQDMFKISGGIDNNLLSYIIKKILVSEKFTEKEQVVIQEKKDFYNKVVDIFSKRSNETADSNKEILFIVQRLKSHNVTKILDAGCGLGRLSLPLAKLGFDVTGIDISDKLLEKAIILKKQNNLLNCNFINSEIQKTSFKSNSFDAVLMMWHVICDMRQFREEGFAEMHRILKHNGILIFDFPDLLKNVQINPEGVYVDKASGLGKYVGHVPELENIIRDLNLLGFNRIEYKRLFWGINKFVIIAVKR